MGREGRGASERGRADGQATARTVTQAGEQRSARLESLRAIAALGVMVGHIWGQSRGYAPAATMNTFWHRTVFGGGYGVHLFFALTGYLLFWPFARRWFGAGAPIDLRRYAINRALRIVPLYYLAVVILLLVQEGGGSASQWWRFLTFSENFSTGSVITVDGPMWSLVVELHFYILLPPFAWLLARACRQRKLVAATILLLLAAASYLAREHAVGGVVHRPLLELSLPGTFIYFVPGMLLALLRLHWEEEAPSWLRGPLASADAWLLTAAAAVLVQFDDYGRLTPIAIASFLAVGACVLPLRPGRLVRLLDWRPLALVGVASYSLYIWHNPLVIHLGTARHLPHTFAGLLPVAGLSSLAVAWLSYRLIEAPFLHLRRQWTAAAVPVGEA